MLLSIDADLFSLQIVRTKNVGSENNSDFFVVASGTAWHEPEKNYNFFLSVFCKK